MGWTTRNRHKSGSSPSLNIKVEIQNSAHLIGPLGLVFKIFDDDSNDDANADDEDARKKWENTHHHPESRLKPPNI